MAAQQPPYVIQASSHSAELFRRGLQAGLASTGVVSSGDLLVSANGTPNMSVNVAAGQAMIPGTLGGTGGVPSGFTSQGAYYAYNDAAVNLAIAAANATNPRIDLVVASVQDAYYSGSANQWVLQVITGTPATSPAAPAAPVSSLVLAQVSVAAAATSITSGNITDQRQFASSWSATQPGAILAAKNVALSYNMIAGSYTVVDAANMVLTFAAPRSGKVLLSEQMLLNDSVSGVHGLFVWGSTTNNSGLVGPVAKTGNIDSTESTYLCHLLTGLTPGATYTLALQCAYADTAGTVAILGATSATTLLCQAL